MSNQIKLELLRIEIPPDLHERSKIGVKKAKSEMEGKIKKSVKKRLISAVLIASLTIPTGVFAYQTLLADELYGSFENVKKHITSATMEGYFLFNAKLSQAKGDMEKEEFEQFKALLSVITTAKLDYGDQFGNIDYSQIPSDQLTEIKKALYDIQPYFDRLNDQKSSKEVLTTEEYNMYIDALMTYETILAQNGINTSKGIDIEKIPSNLQEEFMKAREFLSYVNDKQLQK